jgi:hypothetical protein
MDCSAPHLPAPDANDADGDPSTPVVLFNRDFGHHASPVQHGGHPLVQVLVAVRSGESRETIAAEMRSDLSPRTDAGWRTEGPRGSAATSGPRDGDAPGPGGGGRSGFDGAVIEGECLTDALQPPPVHLLSLLNAGGTLGSLDELSEPPAGGSVNGLFWARGDFNGPLDGQGVLVVHNPAFDPVKHEASRVAIEEGRLVEGLDPAYSHPAPLGRVG